MTTWTKWHVLDVDDVVLEFLRPFMRFLETHGLKLALNSFRLYTNIVHIDTGATAEKDTVDQMISAFFDAQDQWQTLTPDAAETIAQLSQETEIVMLTAMPHRFRDRRRALLNQLGLLYPVLTTDKAKGPALKALRGDTGRPIAFVDDIPHNHESARAALPDAHLFHLMAMPEIEPILPPLPGDVIRVPNWKAAGPQIARALGVKF